MANATLAYDFVNKPSLKAVKGPTLSITRATTATVMGSDGYLQKAASGEARFTGAKRTENLYTGSSTLGSWPYAQVTTATDATVSTPTGETALLVTSVNAISYNANSGNGLSKSYTLTGPLGKAWVVSFYIKAGTETHFRVREGAATGCRARVSFSDGSVVYELGSSSQMSVTATDVGDGWWKVVCYRQTSTDSSVAVNVKPGVDTGTGAETFYFVSPQLEIVPSGTTTPSAYIPTTTAAVSDVKYAETIASHVSRDGLLVEEARTNIALDSEDITSANWTISLANRTANQTTAPDGSLTADLLAATNTSGVHRIYGVAQTITAAVSATGSVFVKAGTASLVQLHSTVTATVYANFNLSTGAVTAESSAGIGFIEDYGNGWYRIGFTWTTASTTESIAVTFISTATSARAESWLAAGTETLYVWGAQIEVGAYHTSYIPTTTASVTRNRETVSFANDGYYRNGEGTFYYLGTPDSPNTGSTFVLFAASGTRFIYRDGLNTNVYDGTTITVGANSVPLGTEQQVAVAWSDSALKQIIYVNGASSDGEEAHVAGSFDLAASAPVYLHSGGSSGNFANGHVKEIAYWPERLSNADLLALSNAEQPVFVGAGESVMLDDDFMRRRRMLRRLRR